MSTKVAENIIHSDPNGPMIMPCDSLMFRPTASDFDNTVSFYLVCLSFIIFLNQSIVFALEFQISILSNQIWWYI